MPSLQVMKPFTVSLDPPPPPPPDASDKDRAAYQEALAEPHVFIFPSPGSYDDVPGPVAEHWYAKPHLAGYEAPPPSSLPVIPNSVTLEAKPETPEEAAKREQYLAERRMGSSIYGADTMPAKPPARAPAAQQHPQAQHSSKA